MGTSRQRQLKEHAWKPRLKGRKTRVQVAASDSSRVADAAITGLTTIDRRLRKGLDVDEHYLEKMALAIDPASLERSRKAAGTRRGSPSGRMMFAVGLGAVCLLSAVGWSMMGTSGHTVAGTVLLDRQPLGNVELRFHPVAQQDHESPQEPVSATASPTGAFRVERLPAGSYSITLHAEPAAAAVPSVYAQPATTPFRLKLARDLDIIRLYAASKPPRR